MPQLKTVGLSPKALLAALIPFIGTLVTTGIMFAVTGEYDKQELVTTLVGVGAAAVAFLGAWAGTPGNVQNA